MSRRSCVSTLLVKVLEGCDELLCMIHCCANPQRKHNDLHKARDHELLEAALTVWGNYAAHDLTPYIRVCLSPADLPVLPQHHIHPPELRSLGFQSSPGSAHQQ